MKRKIITATLTVLFLGVMFGGLFHMSMGMNMTGDISGCPFMSHEETLCSMSVFDHFGVWKDAFTAIAPTFLTLLTALAAVAIIISIAPNLANPHKFLYTRLRIKYTVGQLFTYTIRPWQELFSSGILHPKLF